MSTYMKQMAIWLPRSSSSLFVFYFNGNCIRGRHVAFECSRDFTYFCTDVALNFQVPVALPFWMFHNTEILMLICDGILMRKERKEYWASNKAYLKGNPSFILRLLRDNALLLQISFSLWPILDGNVLLFHGVVGYLSCVGIFRIFESAMGKGIWKLCVKYNGL